MTFIWHVDNLKISHDNPMAVTKMIKYMKNIYSNLSISQDNIHGYLSMTQQRTWSRYKWVNVLNESSILFMMLLKPFAMRVRQDINCCSFSHHLSLVPK